MNRFLHLLQRSLHRHTLTHLGVWLCLLLSGCQWMPERQMVHSDAATDILQSLDHSLQTPVPSVGAEQANAATEPPSVSNALMPSVPVSVGHPEGIPEQRFDLTAQDTPVQAFYMSLVKGTPYNMVVHPSIEGKVSLHLKNVTVAETMEVMRRVYGYEYRHSAMGFEVLPQSLQSRIYHINYLNVRRRGVSEIRVSSGQISESKNNGSNNSSSGTSNTSGGNQNNQAANTTLVSGSEVDTVSLSDFWHELQESLKALIGEKDGRKVIVNPQSGVVIVRAMPNELHDVEDYLIKTQAIIKRQVILEAKILEVELDDGFQSGINWGAFVSSNKTSATIGQTGGGTIFDGTGKSDIAGQTGVLDPNNYSQIANTAASAFGGVFSAALRLDNFNAFIEALKTQGDVHVLSSPRVSTVNNQKAVIKVGSDEFFVTDITTQTNNTTVGSQQSVSVQLTPFFSGVALDVIPQINEHNVVTLHVHPTVSQVTEKVKQIDTDTSGGKLDIPLALSTIRESDSIVSARSGQVIVIGGLMQNVVNDERAGVPLLGDLPFVGGLFRHKKNSSKKSELVILLKPVVVNSGDEWNQQIQQSRDFMGDMLGQAGQSDAGVQEVDTTVGPQSKIE